LEALSKNILFEKFIPKIDKEIFCTKIKIKKIDLLTKRKKMNFSHPTPPTPFDLAKGKKEVHLVLGKFSYVKISSFMDSAN